MKPVSLILYLMAFVLFFSGCGSEKTGIKNDSSSLLLELKSETEHFKYYCGVTDEKSLNDLKKVLEDNYSKITSDLNKELNFKVNVRIFKDLETFHKAINYQNAPVWVVGTASNTEIKMVSPLNPGESNTYDSLIKVAIHELTHVVVNNFFPVGGIPRWLNEGIANYEAHQYSSESIRNIVSEGDIPSFDDLDTYDDKKFGDLNGYIFSYTIVDYIVAEYGIEKLKPFIKSKDFSETFGIDRVEFEEGWKNYLKEIIDD